MKNANVNQSKTWKTYRTRFLIRARQLTHSVSFTDALGREHHGEAGDYLMKSPDGLARVVPHAVFEDIYVAMEVDRYSLGSAFVHCGKSKPFQRIMAVNS